MKAANAYTRTWFETFMNGFPADLTVREVSGLIRWIPRPEFQQVLDVCCGTGRHAERLVDLGYSVTGVDRDPVALDEAQLRVPEGRFVQLDQRHVERVGGVYDAVVILWQSFGYFDSAGNDDVLGQIAALLRPGGRLALDIYHPGYFARHQGRRTDARTGVVAITDKVRGSRLCSTIEYSDGTFEQMDFELFNPEELARRAMHFGFASIGTCCWWDASRPPDPDVPRYQIILERHNEWNTVS